jgi:hypothetical protein
MRRQPTSALKQRAWSQATAWKAATATLPDEARLPAPYLGRHGPTRPTEVCLPAEFASLGLLPEAREAALELFRSLDLVWHDSIAGGPSSHLLDSQVQCANALAPMVHQPSLVAAAFGDVLPIAEVLTVEEDNFLTFEYVGLDNHLGEAETWQARTRGAYFTSSDAAIRYRRPDGKVEMALIEWKYTEDYRGSELDAERQPIRMARYRSLWDDAQCPVRRDLISYDDLFVEPFYQLLRQQLLASQMTRKHEQGAERVRVVHVSPAGNDGFRASLNRDSHRAAGSDVLEIWSRIVIEPGDFISIDSERFCEASRSLTSSDYRARYADSGGPNV